MKTIDSRLFSGRQLVRLIIPLVIEQGLNILVGLADGIMVSSAGEAAISGVSLVDMINAVVLTLFMGLATGGAVVTSQYLGARKYHDAQKSVGQLILMAAVIGTVFGLLCLALARPIMRLFFGSIDADVMEAGLIYFRITALAFPFIALYCTAAAVFRSMGNSKLTMKISILMNLINVTGNAVCVMGLKMGVAGVAIPTLISRVVAASLTLLFLSRRKQDLYLEARYVFHIRGDMMRKILRIGIPSACENSLFNLGRAVVVSMIALFGTVQTSANAVAGTIDNVACIAGNAINLAMVTVIGQCVGNGDAKQVQYYIKKMMLLAYGFWALNSLPTLIFCRPLIGLYSSLSQETAELAFRLIWIHNGLGILMWPMSFTLPNALRAANDVQFTMRVGIASMLIVRVGLSWLLCVVLQWGATGVWIAMVADWIVRISFFLPRVLSGKWKKLCALH
ncbi:MAG: MATE family efflux transporter [Oscillospiraceae bacterium]|nr:MATE family efflux transporter [Oscillospiraceae bacterium]